MLKLVAALAGVELDQLIHRDAQRQTRRTLAWSGAAVAATLVVAVLTTLTLTARAVLKATPAPTAAPPTESAEATVEKHSEKPTPETGAPIMKAIPVQPSEEKPLEIRKAEPVGPLDEVKDRTLLKAATPPPSQEPEE